MSDEIGSTEPVGAPVHLWIVGALALLWNGFGCFDYVMTETRNADYLDMFGAEMRAYLEAFPTWAVGAWAFGVWGGLLGALLLLLRSRFAVAAFALSLVGLALSTVYQYVLTTPPAEMKTTGMLAMNALIWAIAIFLLVYAMRQRKAGVLR